MTITDNKPHRIPAWKPAAQERSAPSVWRRFLDALMRALAVPHT